MSVKVKAVLAMPAGRAPTGSFPFWPHKSRGRKVAMRSDVFKRLESLLKYESHPMERVVERLIRMAQN